MENWPKRVYKSQRRSAIILAVLVASCGGGGGGGDGGGTIIDDDLQSDIQNRFPYTPNMPLDQLFICNIAGSNLLWYMNFFQDGNMEVYATLDNGDNISRNGMYTHANDVITLNINNDVIFLEESSTNIDTALGMVSHFVTPNARCYTYGHRYNQNEPASTMHYQCSDSNIQPATRDVNAIEFVHAAVPFEFPVTGSVFRQRDRYISGNADPTIKRGYGIYRRDGDRFFMFFDLQQFDDFEYLSGAFENSETEISLDQTAVADGSCGRT